MQPSSESSSQLQNPSPWWWQVGTEGHQEPEQRVALEPGSPLAIAGQTGGERAP